jgi:hypothetical protein
MTYTFLPESDIIHIVTLVMLSFVKGCVHWVLIFFSKMICYPYYLLASPQKILACITPHQNMHPPPIYPQLPHLHNHGLAMSVCITPFQNMCPPPVYWSHLKRSFWKSDFLLKYHQNPEVLKRQSKKQERGRERKAPRVSSNKWEINILREEKHFNFKNPFQCDSIFSPSIIPFQKPFPKLLRKFS